MRENDGSRNGYAESPGGQGNQAAPPPAEKDRDRQSSRELVYEYLQEQMQQGALLPGSVLDLKAISAKLHISSTPLRDSLIRLEAEGYLTIHPRSKVVINTLELADFPYLYEIMGALEFTVIANSMEAYTEETLDRMRGLNARMHAAVLAGDMGEYDGLHYAFHETFFQISPNIFAKRILTPIKNRLWDFPRKNFVQEWYLAAVREHSLIVDAIAERSAEKLTDAIKGLHWGYKHNEPYIKKIYNLE